MRSVIFVARTLGRFDVLATVRAFSAAQLVEILDAIRALPGVGGGRELGASRRGQGELRVGVGGNRAVTAHVAPWWADTAGVPDVLTPLIALYPRRIRAP